MNTILNSGRPGTVAGYCLVFLICLAGLAGMGPAALAAESINEKVSSAAEQAGKTIDDTGKAAVSKIGQLWQKVDESRLMNRTPDEIVAWVLMGLLVGGALAQFAKVTRVIALVLGLAGSFVGGMVAHVTQINLGLGPVLIRYEDLLFSLVGGLLFVFAIRALMKRKQPKS